MPTNVSGQATRRLILRNITKPFATNFYYKNQMIVHDWYTNCLAKDKSGFLVTTPKTDPNRGIPCLKDISVVDRSNGQMKPTRSHHTQMTVTLTKTDYAFCLIRATKIPDRFEGQHIPRSQLKELSGYYMKIINRDGESSECIDGEVLPRDRFFLENRLINLKKAMSNMTDGEEGIQSIGHIMTNSVPWRMFHGSSEHLQGHSQLSATRPDILIDDQRRLHHDNSIGWSDEYNPSPAINQIDMGGQNLNRLPQVGGTRDFSDGSVNLNLKQLGNILNRPRFSSQSNICSHIPSDDPQHRIPHSPPCEDEDMDFTSSESYIPFGGQVPLIDDEVNSSPIGDTGIFRQFRSDFDDGEICAPSEFCSPASTCKIPKD
jgi:hypothetical protein